MIANRRTPFPACLKALHFFVLLAACMAAMAPQAGCSSDEMMPGDEPPPPLVEQRDALLAELRVLQGTLSPAFSPDTKLYTVYSPLGAAYEQVLARPRDPRATLLINGVQVQAGHASTAIALESAVTMVTVLVQTPEGLTERYSLVLKKNLVTTDYFKASNTGADDLFGQTLSIDGDTMAVGAPMESSNAKGVNGPQDNDDAFRSGAVYVFRLRDNQWEQEAYIKASNAGRGDLFGFSVSVSGDTLAVGARFEASKAVGIDGDQANNGASFGGAVYVFQRTDGVWRQEAYVKASNTGSFDEFGFRVSLSGDTLAVSAPGEGSAATGIDGDQADNRAFESGAVYVFQRTDGVWKQEAYIKASNTERRDYFGWTLSLSGDTLAVGAVYEDSSATGVDGDQSKNNASNSGAVYMFHRSGGTWAQEAYIKASNAGVGDVFGYVSLSGDLLAVGAVYGDSGGAVYVFRRSGRTWAEEAYINASNADSGDGFGLMVALSGNTLAVGAVQEDGSARGINGDQADNSAEGSGAVYLFQRTADGWRQTAYVKAPNTEAGDLFGAVALSGNRLAVGASKESSSSAGINGDPSDNGLLSSGAVYLFTQHYTP